MRSKRLSKADHERILREVRDHTKLIDPSRCMCRDVRCAEASGHGTYQCQEAPTVQVLGQYPMCDECGKFSEENASWGIQLDGGSN
jgi:hypothetical protein